MAQLESVAASAGGVGAGVGSTLLIRRQFDQSGETTILRPSVLWGVGTGAAALTTSIMFMNGRGSSLANELLEDYGEAAITAGAVSAFVPGGNAELPTV